MTAKNKEDFLFQLHTELHRIGVENNEDIFADFEEHFRASSEQGYTEEQTCEKLGDVKEIARSYIDIDSSRINSIVANAIEDSRPHVSLTKPGRNEPADSVKAPVEAPVIEEAPHTEIIADQPAPIREYTPEHIAAEPAPSSAPVSAPRVNIAKSSEPVQSTQSVQPVQGTPVEAAASAAPVREFTPQHTSSEPAPEAQTNTEQNTAAAPQGAEAPKDPHVAEIPPQCGEPAGSGKGFRWTDLKGKSPNPDIGRLIMWICLDLFVFTWAIPALGGLVVGYFGIVVSLGGAAVTTFAVPSMFHLLSRIFLGTGLACLTVMLGALGVKIAIGYIKIIRNIVIAHIKAIYDL